MCRLLAVSAARPGTLADHLGPDLDAFVAMSARHKDGWGLASSSGGGQTLEKFPEQAMASARFAEASSTTRALQFLFHLRLASPNSPHTTQNTHPFVADHTEIGDVAFAHNGHVFDRRTLNRRRADVTDSMPEGSTDSEDYFLIVLSLMERGESAGRALAMAMRIVGEPGDYISLNAILSTSEGLWVIAAAHPDPERGDLDRQPAPEQFTLEYRAADGVAVVASNEWQRVTDDWHAVPNEHLLFLPAGGGEPTVIGVDEVLRDQAA